MTSGSCVGVFGLSAVFWVVAGGSVVRIRMMMMMGVVAS